MRTLCCDLCVIGSGLAGISAAITASRAGLRVALVSQGPLCSGSSFSGRTWGLGMVLPRSRSQEDVDALLETVLDVGRGVENPAVVRAILQDSYEAVELLAGAGAVISAPRPGHENERAYIPCFDHEVRGWRGFHALESVAPLKEALRASGALLLEHADALSLLKNEAGAVAGVFATARDDAGSLEPAVVRSRGVVVATGGIAGLFASNLVTPFSNGTGHALALHAGAALRNLEFLQIMTGIEGAGAPLVFNEKLWGRTRLTDARSGRSAFELTGTDEADAREALDAHAIHGPFTTERPSCRVERAIAAACLRDGCLATTDLADEGQEFVQTFLAWMESRGLDPREPQPVRLFAQASNGGIAIDETGFTGVPGLYAVGECASMFGADRVGGLASLGALVTGMRAAKAAAQSCCSTQSRSGVEGLSSGKFANTQGSLECCSPLSAAPWEGDRRETREHIGALDDRALLGERTDAALEGARNALGAIVRALDELPQVSLAEAAALDGPALEELRANTLLASAALVSLKTCEAALARTESLGPHLRA